MRRAARWLRWDARVWTGALVFALAFFLLAQLSAPFVFAAYQNAVVWVPGGLALGVFIRTDPRNWGPYVLAIFGAELASVVFHTAPEPFIVSINWAVANVVRTVVGAALIRRFAGGPVTFERMRDVACFTLFGGVVAPLLSALIGTGGVQLIVGGTDFWQDALFWFLSDATGSCLIAPLVLTFRPETWSVPNTARIVEWVGFLVVLVLVGSFILGSPPGGIAGAMPYASFPLLIWAALRLGPFGASVSAIVLGTIAVTHTLRGEGPFSRLIAPPYLQVLSVEVFLALVSLSVLTLAAAVRERQRLEEKDRLVADVGGLLAESLEIEATLRRVVDRIVSDGPRAAAIWLKHPDGSFELVAVAGLTHDLRIRLSEQIRYLSSDVRSWVDPQINAVLAPMPGHQESLGVLALVPQPGSGSLTPRELARIEDLARRCALAVENARNFERAQSAIRVREEFIAIAAHELRTPLTTMRLQLEAALRYQPEDQGNRTSNLLRQVKRLTRLVENLLDISRLSRGRVELNREPVVLGALVGELADRLSGDAAQACSELEVQVEEEVLGDWDRLRLEQVITNLLSNAMKFGGGAPIEIRVARHDHLASVTVTDHGRGIAPEELEHIFDRFAQAVPAREYGGLGLGLYVARQLAEAHGGRLWAESEAGQGSTFHLELPARPAVEARPSEPAPAS